jgi:polysaccharide export outer membrane protein
MPARPAPARRTVALIALVLAIVVRSAAAQRSDGTATLQPGDSVRLLVWENPQYSGSFIVTADSVLSHPLLDSVKVVGVPIREVSRRLTAKVAQEQKNPRVLVASFYRVVVGGEVVQPRLYMLPDGTTISQAVGVAGGPTDRGKLNSVTVIRGGRTLRLDLNDPKSEAARMPVFSGDQIRVGRKSNFFRDVLTPFTSLTAAVVAIVVAVRQ